MSRSMVAAALNSKTQINKCKRKTYYHRFKCVPKELLTEILARVASSSFTDLFNAKASCKEFLEAASENYVFEHVKINSFPVIPWKINHGVSSFIDKCKKSGNPEALFRQGMIDYFSTLEHDSGLDYLKIAANKGHVEATYVYAVILVCYGGEFRKQGLKLLSDLKRSKSSLVINECRKKVKRIVRSMWVNNYVVGVGPEDEDYRKNRNTCTCNTKALFCFNTNMTNNRSRWTSDEDFEDNTFSCDSCLWDLEAIQFCNMLRTGSFRL